MSLIVILILFCLFRCCFALFLFCMCVFSVFFFLQISISIWTDRVSGSKGLVTVIDVGLFNIYIFSSVSFFATSSVHVCSIVSYWKAHCHCLLLHHTDLWLFGMITCLPLACVKMMMICKNYHKKHRVKKIIIIKLKKGKQYTAQNNTLTHSQPNEKIKYIL